jgi:hypothetical protein
MYRLPNLISLLYRPTALVLVLIALTLMTACGSDLENNQSASPLLPAGSPTVSDNNIPLPTATQTASTTDEDQNRSDNEAHNQSTAETGSLIVEMGTDNSNLVDTKVPQPEQQDIRANVNQAEATQNPQITLFKTPATQVFASQLEARLAYIPVTWHVANRPPNSNLYFEQIIEGQATNVELPRDEPYVPSEGSGIVAPINPNNTSATTIELQLSLRDMTSDWIYVSAHISLPIVSESPNAQINHFTTTPTSAVEGETITVSWDVSGVNTVLLDMSYFGEPRRYWPERTFANSGTTTFLAPAGTRSAELILGVDSEIRQSLVISVNCRFAWFSASDGGDSYCPANPAQSIQAVYQPFEGGYMISRQNSPYVWFYFSDTDSFDAMPENAPVSAEPFDELPPADLFRPTNNFGRLWTGLPHLRDRLGWAVAPQQGYTMTYQQTPWAIGTRGQQFRLFTLPDSSVVGAMIDLGDGDG